MLLLSFRSRPGAPSRAAKMNDDDGCSGGSSALSPSVEANDLSALSPLGVDASSSSSDVPVPVLVPLCDVAKLNPCFSNFCRRTDFRSSSSSIAFTLKSPLENEMRNGFIVVPKNPNISSEKLTLVCLAQHLGRMSFHGLNSSVHHQKYPQYHHHVQYSIRIANCSSESVQKFKKNYYCIDRELIDG